MSLTGASTTMLAACAARAAHANDLNDTLSPKLLACLPGAEDKRLQLDAASRGMFSRSILVRTLHFQSQLRAALQPETQLIILSHGLDFCAMARALQPGRKIFAVDHPHSQHFACAVSSQAGIHVSARFVACDLAIARPEGLLAALSAAQFEPDQHTVVLWEGATYYLEPTDTFAVLRMFAKHLANVTVFADFLNANGYFRDGEYASPGVQRSLAFIESLGEPWLGFFDPTALIEQLTSAGFDSATQVDRAAVEQRVLGSRMMEPNMMFFLEASKTCKQ